jgi:hypothetical protein
MFALLSFHVCWLLDGTVHRVYLSYQFVAALSNGRVVEA